MQTLKVIVTSKKKLSFKYGKNFAKLESLLKSLIEFDKKRDISTRIVYIDDNKSTESNNLSAVTIVNEKESKRIIDEIYQKHQPAYIVILGAYDVIPFQILLNPADDEDQTVESDLPYACDVPYSKNVSSFIGPTRVVSRLPDVPGVQENINYFEKLIANIIKTKPVESEKYNKYFAVSTAIWKKSTALNLQTLFSDNKMLVLSPSTLQNKPYTKAQLEPLMHFYNCHGAKVDPNYYGQKGNSYPEALKAANLKNNIAQGTVIAAECCYGAQLYNPEKDHISDLSIANTYLENGAIAFLGSTNIAYGPSDNNSLADLLTQYFVKSILDGSSTGHALLEARQKFLLETGPQLDPYEQKTLAQFVLLGDGSVQPVIGEQDKQSKTLAEGSIQNARNRLYMKGISLQKSISPSRKQTNPRASANTEAIEKILKKTSLLGEVKESVYAIKPNPHLDGFTKNFSSKNVVFRTFIKTAKRADYNRYKILVVKENSEQILGWRVYESR